jgi:tetratricopeptide (TPR) repeat protein
MSSLEIAAGRFVSALSYQERLVQQDPSPESQRRLAYLYLQVGRYHDALPVYERILTGPDADAGSMVNMGLAKSALGDDKGAIAAYRRALAVDPKLLEARLDLGIALYRTGDEAGSRETLAAYLLAAPKGESTERVRKFLTALGWKPPSPAPAGGEAVGPAATGGGS